ncbi:GNAT family N-acetyltransferase [Glycomyces tenuis]|uniref:GNAT family N-acetyltransferase n=1 Tax=Glycomyces tenuis TaxID=58116 RepID=UPI00040455EF|nr:GNAT family N-acetyltransferase [Glycomyces tenuis]
MDLRFEVDEARWRAFEGSRLLGEAWTVRRPDGKRFVSFGDGAVVELARRIGAEYGEALYTQVDASDARLLRLLGSVPFVGDRFEHRWEVPTRTGLSEAPLEGFKVYSPEEIGHERVRVFDDLLRQDIPGLWGWQWTAGGWRAEHGSAYDPALYPVVWDPRTEELAGMARVWSNPVGPRLGLVAVARAFRRRRLGAALLARIGALLAERGFETVTTECDASNLASFALLSAAGGRRVGGTVELVYRP